MIQTCTKKDISWIRFFARLKENKRIAMQFDKLNSTFSSFIAIAIIKLLKLFW